MHHPQNQERGLQLALLIINMCLNTFFLRLNMCKMGLNMCKKGLNTCGVFKHSRSPPMALLKVK